MAFEKQQISPTLYVIQFDATRQNLKARSLNGYYITASSSTIDVYYRNISKVNEGQLRIQETEPLFRSVCFTHFCSYAPCHCTLIINL